MSFAPWIRDHLDRAHDWRVVLDRLRSEVMASPSSPARAQQLLELAEAVEHVDPDRTRVLALYAAAYRDGDPSARPALLRVASELRAHVTLAEVAIGDHAETRDPESLLTAARAFIDAGLPERATQIFLDAVNEHASLAERMPSAPALRDMRVAIARARHQRVDVESEIDACLAHAATDGPAAHLLAARIARLAESPRYAALIKAAARAYPADINVARLFEDQLLEAGDADALLTFHSARLEAAKGEAAWLECVREAAFELLMRNTHPGLGLRLLRTSLEHAYTARLPTVPRHLASWELLVAAARESRSTVSLSPLLLAAVDASLPPEDIIYVATLGLQITWRDARDPIAAYVYATRLAHHVPDHPLAAAFFAEHAKTEPTPLTVTFKIPTIKPPAPAAPEPSPEPPPVPAAPEVPVRAPRKVVPLDVVVELSTGAFFSAVLRDVSTSGAFVATKRPLEVGSTLALEIRVPVSRGIAQKCFRTDARVARRSDLGCGLQFIDAPMELVEIIESLLA